MTQNEMVRNLAEKCDVNREEARAALEIGEWNMLTAAQQLECDKLRKAQAVEEAVSSCEAATAQATASEAVEGAQTAQNESCEQAERPARTAAGMHCGDKGLKNLGDHIRRLVACGNRNRFLVRRGEAVLLELPVTVVAVLMLFAFWTCVPLLAVGLFLGCRYSFSGQDLGRKGINDALDRAAAAAEHLRGSAAEA